MQGISLGNNRYSSNIPEDPEMSEGEEARPEGPSGGALRDVELGRTQVAAVESSVGGSYTQTTNVGSAYGSKAQLVGEPTGFRKVLHQLNLEALPRLANYRRSFSKRRPSIGELYGDAAKNGNGVANGGTGENQLALVPAHAGMKLGWIEGVLIPCLLNTWGVMLFLRLSWVTGQAGIWQSQLIIAISAVVCVITSLSLAAITTNGEVKGGGIYFIVSRSLGAEFGASVGVIFAFANTVAASMNTIGFCESLNDLLRLHDTKIIDGGVNDIRLVGVIAIFVMVLICAAGIEWESKAQNVLIVLIIVAMGDFLIGASWGPMSDLQIARGFTGFKAQTLIDNFWPDYRFSEGQEQNFFSIFAIFFPCVTGLQAGANISGDLKDPGTAIPKGTLLSLLISMASYSLLALYSGLVAVRDASGDVTELASREYLNCKTRHCEYGLMNSYSVMQLCSLSGGILIYIGCFAATLSTALTNLLSVPRLIQALGNDRIYPGVIFFSKAYGKTGEPLRGYVIVFFASSAFLLIANLNTIAPLISNFYLASYALINFCTFHAAFVQPLGWRPKFRYYNKWISFIGFVICLAIMLLINIITTILTVVLFFTLYVTVIYRNPDANWGSSTQANVYKTALTSTLKLNYVSDHVKNYRPQILCLSGMPHHRPALVKFADCITKKCSLLLAVDLSDDGLGHKQRLARIDQGNAWLRSNKIRGFFNVVQSDTFESAAKSVIQAAGIGKLRPDILMVGFKEDWRDCPYDELLGYFHTIQFAFENRMSVTVLRLPPTLNSNGGHVNKGMDETELIDKNSFAIARSVSGIILPSDSNYDLTKEVALTSSNTEATINLRNLNYSNSGMSPVLEHRQKGTIDIWWLYDDGGLTVLLPYIVSTRKRWSDCDLRVFALTNHHQDIAAEERNLANLLSKFRIGYSSLKILSELDGRPRKETVTLFESLLSSFRHTENTIIRDEEMNLLSEKTNRLMKLHEFLHANSKDAALVVVSLPIPRKDVVSAPLYMAWLELLTSNMPPCLLTRGNHTDVLTFYS
ncbi:bumetanide-sensitive sodium-(potassium)-chloride cotransporter isoform X2 [Bemisia tabaci]|uniref:bumetanide-sensitive sodium-(potassium)-chloride cotransporter isoform X2 n=1 Tax=Bemisia tabaci TaxID=7038 RepID=UPI003B282937